MEQQFKEALAYIKNLPAECNNALMQPAMANQSTMKPNSSSTPFSNKPQLGPTKPKHQAD